MKTILALCGVILVAGSVALYRATRPKLIYGQFVGAPSAQVAELIARPKANMGKTWAIQGVINKQCTSMGCFFFFEDGGKELRVDLAEIAMHAPKNRNGRPARAEGQVVPYGDGYQFWASAVEFR
ncbi:MAG: hypothetical protein HYZ74_09250 [Elusimicrobia bacterium]|nr:hypothetical protein [Elusimicrobiota bacterium]